MAASERLVALREARDEAETAIAKAPLDPQRLADFDLAKAVYENALAEEAAHARREAIRETQQALRVEMRAEANARRA